jgi:hypothetical protein
MRRRRSHGICRRLTSFTFLLRACLLILVPHKPVLDQATELVETSVAERRRRRSSRSSSSRRRLHATAHLLQDVCVCMMLVLEEEGARCAGEHLPLLLAHAAAGS